MAKVKLSPLINSYKGSIGGMTIVNTKNGTFARKDRSTRDTNEVLQKSAKAMREAIPYARSIYWAFELYRKDVSDSGVWTRLRHLFRKALVDRKPMDYTFLRNFRFQNSSLDSMASPRLTTSVDTSKNLLKLSLSFHIKFPEDLKMDGFQITIVPLIAYAATKTAEVSGVFEFIEKDIEKVNGVYEAEMALPVNYDAIVVAVKVGGYKEGKSANQKVNAMEILEVLTPSAKVNTEHLWLNDFAM